MRSGRITTEVAQLAASFLVSRSGRPIILEVEIRSDGIETFMEEYRAVTGTRTQWEKFVEDGCAFDMGEGKWGRECRIYFPDDTVVRNQLRRYGFNVERGDVRHGNTWRINNNLLWQVLVDSHGLRLGSND